MLRVVTEIESIADSCNNLARGIKRKVDGKSHFSSELDSNVDQMYSLVVIALTRMNVLLEKNETLLDDVNASYNYENDINNLRNQLKIRNMEDVDAKKYNYQDGVYYIDLITEFEKLGDYILNVVQATVEKKV